MHHASFGWRNVPVRAALEEALDYPLFVVNTAHALGQAEMWLGAGRGARDAVVTLWGTGVGAAIFTGGALYRGVGSSAGEWGHTCVVVEGDRCRCGAHGCLEAYVGAEALLRQWHEAEPDLDTEEEDLARLVRAAATSDSAAHVLERAATYFGAATANLVNLFNPERIVIGGWAGMLLGPSLLGRIDSVMRTQALELPADRVTIELAQLGDDVIALGAATLVVDEVLTAGGRPAVIAKLSR